MPETPIIIKGNSVTIAFDGENFEKDGDRSVYEFFQSGVEILKFNNPEAKILRVEITDGDQCGTILFEPKDGKCTIKIICDVPYEGRQQTQKTQK